MSEAGAVRSEQRDLVCRVTKRSEEKGSSGERMFRELERLGVSAAILESLWKAQEDQSKRMNR